MDSDLNKFQARSILIQNAPVYGLQRTKYFQIQLVDYLRCRSLLILITFCNNYSLTTCFLLLRSIFKRFFIDYISSLWTTLLLIIFNTDTLCWLKMYFPITFNFFSFFKQLSRSVLQELHWELTLCFVW